MDRAVHVRAPSRLHFGMFSFGHATGPRFGGVGAMVDSPAVEVHIWPAQQFAVHGPLAHRAERFALAAAKSWQLPRLLQCEIEVNSSSDHTGLGVGTQLGLAVADGLRWFMNLPELSVKELAIAVGRGKRSAIGTHGFDQGGLLVDAGKYPDDSLGVLQQRVHVPDEWRFVLLLSNASQGLADEIEAHAFAQLPPVPRDVTTELWRITNDEMLPAVDAVDCRAFGDAVYKFGRLAGECFAPVQGGPFATPETAQLIEAIRDHGIPGAGQSSWGPTVFAVTQDESDAQTLVEKLQVHLRSTVRRAIISRPNNCGAQLSTSS